MTHCCVCNESDCKPRCSLTWCESHTQGRIKLGLLKPKTVAEAQKVWSQIPEGVRLSPALNGVGIPVYEGPRSVQEAQQRVLYGEALQGAAWAQQEYRQALQAQNDQARYEAYKRALDAQRVMLEMGSAAPSFMGSANFWR